MLILNYNFEGFIEHGQWYLALERHHTPRTGEKTCVRCPYASYNRASTNMSTGCAVPHPVDAIAHAHPVIQISLILPNPVNMACMWPENYTGNKTTWSYDAEQHISIVRTDVQGPVGRYRKRG